MGYVKEYKVDKQLPRRFNHNELRKGLANKLNLTPESVGISASLNEQGEPIDVTLHFSREVSISELKEALKELRREAVKTHVEEVEELSLQILILKLVARVERLEELQGKKGNQI